MPHPRYSSDEIVRRGEAIYAREIRHRVEPGQNGRFLALDIETGDYELADEMLAALDRAKAKRAEAALYVIRVGAPSAVKIGGNVVSGGCFLGSQAMPCLGFP